VWRRLQKFHLDLLLLQLFGRRLLGLFRLLLFLMLLELLARGIALGLADSLQRNPSETSVMIRVRPFFFLFFFDRKKKGLLLPEVTRTGPHPSPSSQSCWRRASSGSGGATAAVLCHRPFVVGFGGQRRERKMLRLTERWFVTLTCWTHFYSLLSLKRLWRKRESMKRLRAQDRWCFIRRRKKKKGNDNVGG